MIYVVGLTVRQKRFCDNYMQSGNATQSYINAGYKVEENVAAVNANRLLRNANIQAQISSRQEKVQNKKILSIAEIQEDLTSIAKKAMKKQPID